MEIAMNNNSAIDFIGRIKNISNLCKISNIEKILSDCFENMPSDSPINYIGELNKNDIMH